ncbi:predicted protein [Botrytis cinerea T4]|uniref:Uncharacterized protein n=1 Tax=Botryotinia fuckeliana (strain T4) TaxID=999810 RepID=G2YSH8_BOTF4|nr:predicted protein [Botrytis cinerea T4]
MYGQVLYSLSSILTGEDAPSSSPFYAARFRWPLKVKLAYFLTISTLQESIDDTPQVLILAPKSEILNPKS